MKRVLILGCGYVGRAFGREALAQGYEVWALTRNESTIDELSGLGFQTIQGAIQNSDWHGLVPEGIDLVLNCVSSAGNGLEGYRLSYVEGNRSVSQWIRETGFAGTAIYTSSVSVYSDSGGDWLGESDAAPGNERGKLMLESENEFLVGGSAARKFVLRLGGIYGPDRHMLLNRVRGGRAVRTDDNNYHLNLIRLEDINAAIWAVARSESLGGGLFNVVDSEPVLKSTLLDWMALQTGIDLAEGEEALESTSSRRFAGESRVPSDRRISNRALKLATGWEPKFPNFRKGFGSLI